MSTFDIVQGVACSYEEACVVKGERKRKPSAALPRPHQQCTWCGASLRRRKAVDRPCSRCGGAVVAGNAPEAARFTRESRERKAATRCK